jgi:hypothetical protein
MSRKSIVLGLIFFYAWGSTARSEDGPDSEGRQTALRRARESYYAAYYRGDTEAMSKFEDHDIAVIHDRTPKPQSGEAWRADIRKLVEAKQWNPKRMIGESVRLTVRLGKSGASVVGIGLVETPAPVGTGDSGGTPRKEYKAFSETWIEADGRWKLVQLHSDYRTLPGADEEKN